MSRFTLDLKERLSDTEDADMAEMITQLQTRQVAYQAALLAASKISEINILNYL
jgi:flagellin-like hook-associated protein FlgL